MRRIAFGVLGMAALLSAGCGSDPAPSPTPQVERGWRKETPLAAFTQENTAVALDDGIVTIGGFEGLIILERVQRYDPNARTWSELPPLPAKRHHVPVAVLDGALYALGGLVGGNFEPSAQAFRLDRGASEWTPIASLPAARGAAYATELGGKLYVAGGYGAESALLAATYVYDPATDTWDLGAPIPTPREHLGGFVHGGKLWTVGGRRFSLDSNLDAVEIYDPAGDSWTTGPSLPTARGGLGVAVLGDTAYAMGGETPDFAYDVNEALDLKTLTWSTTTPLPGPRHGFGAAALGGRVYVIGGADRPVFAAIADVDSFGP